MNTNPNESAFSASAYTDPLAGKGQDHTHPRIPGLTKREHFAAMMMQGLVASPKANITEPEDANRLALIAAHMADTLIAELNKIRA